MCGIYGLAKSPRPYSSHDLKVAKKVLRAIAVESEARGSHSSGIAQIGQNTKIHKSLLPSSKFVNGQSYAEAVNSLIEGNRILLGHTRFATEGAVTKANAHPFKVGSVIGAHNGCVYNFEEMQTRLDKKCPVDSQLIFKSININDNLTNAVKHFDSDFALSFIKEDPLTLYLCRESNRPLFVAYVQSLQTLFYASEKSFIEKGLMNGKVKSADIFELNKNTLYKFDTRLFGNKVTNVNKTVFEYESRVYQWQMNNYNQADDDWTSILGSKAFNDDGSINSDWELKEKQEWAEAYGGSPNDYFFDVHTEQWYYIDHRTNTILSEYQIVDGDMYGDIEFEDDDLTDDEWSQTVLEFEDTNNGGR